MPPSERGDAEERREAPAEEVIIIEETVTVASPETEAIAAPEDPEERHPEEIEEQNSEDMPYRLLTPWEGIAKFFYDVFNPFLIPTYVTLLLFELTILGVSAPGAALPYTLTVFGATCIVPVVVLVFLRKFGVVSTLGLDSKRDRFFPYVVTLLTMGAMALLFVLRGAPSWLWTVYIGGCATILINMIVNFRLKVSNHASAIAGMLAVLIVIQWQGMPIHQLGWWAIGAAVMCGVIGTGALLVGRHRLIDVLVGYVTGFLPIILFALIK